MDVAYKVRSIDQRDRPVDIVIHFTENQLQSLTHLSWHFSILLLLLYRKILSNRYSISDCLKDFPFLFTFSLSFCKEESNFNCFSKNLVNSNSYKICFLTEYRIVLQCLSISVQKTLITALFGPLSFVCIRIMPTLIQSVSVCVCMRVCVWWAEQCDAALPWHTHTHTHTHTHARTNLAPTKLSPGSYTGWGGGGEAQGALRTKQHG